MTFFTEPLLAIETSCDETSAAVLRGPKILSNIVSSQEELHRKWGGIVPEAAARAHVEAILPVITRALEAAGVDLDGVRAVAATNRPGLVGALSVGLTAATAIAYARNLPFIAVHHLEGHLCSILSGLEATPFPNLSLIASGGHTELVHVHDLGRAEIVGHTLDDAAGEAFDKGARLLGLGYPGGRAVQEAAARGNPARYLLPRGLSGDTANFSFSGLKTAMRQLVEKEGDQISVPDAAASLQHAIASVLSDRTARTAVKLGVGTVCLVGGVAANLELRRRLTAECAREGLRFLCPPAELCTDNAAMIGLAASVRLARGERHDLRADVYPNADLPEG